MLKKNYFSQAAFLALLASVTPFLSDRMSFGLPLLILFSLFIIIYFKEIIINANKPILLYVLIICVGLIAHFFIDIKDNFIDGLKWIAIFPLMHYCCQNKKGNMLLVFFATIFFCSEISISLYEKITHSFVFNYHNTDFVCTDPNLYSGLMDFRSIALLKHPLNNANVISIFMAFILCDNKILKKYKIILISLCCLSLWAFNTRGAMLCWIIILFYKLFLYKRKIWVSIVVVSVLYLLLPIILAFLQGLDFLGRLNFNFSDDSTQARLLSFSYFMKNSWSLQDLLIGGRLLMLPGSTLSLENGGLLTLGYWGVIIGSLKILLEFFITYKALSSFILKDKLIIMFAFWGVAYMNNNSFNPMVLCYFALVNIVFQSDSKYKIPLLWKGER